MQVLRRIVLFPALAILAATAPGFAATGQHDAALFAALTPVGDLGSITGKAGVNADNLLQISTTTIASGVSDVTLGNSGRAGGSMTAFNTGGIQGLSFSGLGGANAIAINTGIASNQTQSVTVNLSIGSIGSPSGAFARGR